jgi:hypothetical protein
MFSVHREHALLSIEEFFARGINAWLVIEDDKKLNAYFAKNEIPINGEGEFCSSISTKTLDPMECVLLCEIANELKLKAAPYRNELAKCYTISLSFKRIQEPIQPVVASPEPQPVVAAPEPRKKTRKPRKKVQEEKEEVPEEPQPVVSPELQAVSSDTLALRPKGAPGKAITKPVKEKEPGPHDSVPVQLGLGASRTWNKLFAPPQEVKVPQAEELPQWRQEAQAAREKKLRSVKDGNPMRQEPDRELDCYYHVRDFCEKHDAGLDCRKAHLNYLKGVGWGNFRTVDCIHFKKGACNKGEDCTFRHEGVEQVEKPFRTIQCRHYARGRCTAGDTCTFLHDDAQVEKISCCIQATYGTCPYDAKCHYEHFKENERKGAKKLCVNLLQTGHCNGARGKACPFYHPSSGLKCIVGHKPGAFCTVFKHKVV